MKKTSYYTLIIVLLISAFGCQNDNQKNSKFETAKANPLVANVLTAKEQSALTPDMVIKNLLEGNKRYMNNDITPRDYPAMIRKSTNSQYPEAIVLSCIDSRVPVEDVLDEGIGDIFVARVAGNFANTDIIGSMEYACKVAGSKLILVLGHEHCGAIKSAIDDVELGNITHLLSNIKPAIDNLDDFDGVKSSKNEDYIHAVCEQNVLNTIAEIRAKSPILKSMEENGEIKIVGAIYNMITGEINIKY